MKYLNGVAWAVFYFCLVKSNLKKTLKGRRVNSYQCLL